MASKSANPITKRRQRPFSLTEKTMIYNMFSTLRCKATSNTSNNNVLKTVASNMGIHWVSVYKIVKEMNSKGVLRSPKMDKPRPTVIDKTDGYTKDALRDIIQQFHRRKEVPTLNKILKVVNDDGTLGRFKRTSLYKILSNIGFQKSGKQELNSMLEDQEIDEASPSFDVHIKTESEDPLTLPGTSYESDILDIKLEYEDTKPTVGFIKIKPSETESNITNDTSGYNVLNPKQWNDNDNERVTEIVPEMVSSVISIIKTEPSEMESDIANDSSRNNLLNSKEWHDNNDDDGNTDSVPKITKPIKRRAISSASRSRAKRPK